MTISVPPKGNADRECGANFAPISVEAQFTPNLTVKIKEGSFWTAEGDYVEYVGGNSATMLAATAGNAKWNVISLDSNGLIQIIEGVDSTSPTLPSIPANALPLAAIYIQETTTAITNDMVFDIRPLFVSQADTVPDLSGELAQRPTITAVNTLLLNKADIGGTPDSVFLLNQDLTGIGVADAALTVNRGSEPDVSIRWNETTDKWELSNDGTVYTPIETGGSADWGLITGTLSAQTDLQAALDAKAGSVHTHLEADVTDLDKYTQAEVTGLLAGKADSVHTHIKANVTDFTETDYVHTTGVETVAGAKTFSDNGDFSADLNVVGDLTANNGTTSLLVGGSAGFGLNDAGLDLTRIAGPNALLFWEESTQQWMVGTVGDAAQILTESVIDVKADKIIPGTVGDFAGLDATGNLTDSGSSAADFATAAQGATADSALQPADILVVPATAGDFAALDVSGNIIDGGAQASDFATAAQGTLADSATQPADNVSTLTNDANFQGQVPPAAAGDFASLDVSGNITDSGSAAADFATAAQGSTADSALQPADILVVPATTGDFAALDVSGNIIDGGSAAADFATAAQGSTADSATQPSDNVSTLTNDASYTTDAGVATNHYTKTESDATTPAAGAKVDKVAGTSGNIVEFGASNVIVDSGSTTADFATSAQGSTADTAQQPTLTATTAELAAIANAINTGALKVAGYMVFNTTSGAPVWAVGDTDGAVWNNATGATAHTPA